MPIGDILDSGKLKNTRWDDLSVSATSTKVGSNLRPDFDYVNLGLLFPQNNTSENVYLTFQMSHKKKLNSAVRLHIHFIQTSAAIPVFGATVRFYNNGNTVPSFSSEIETTSEVPFDWISGSLLNIIEFPEINAPVNENLSANLDVILYRKDNVVTGDVLVKYIDLHYEIDTDGSNEEYVK
jgi:hypothetical protein